MSVELDSKHFDQMTVISIAGSIDALTAAAVTKYFKQELEGGHPRIVVDLSGVDFMSSAGLRAILLHRWRGGFERHRPNGSLRKAPLAWRAIVSSTIWRMLASITASAQSKTNPGPHEKPSHRQWRRCEGSDFQWARALATHAASLLVPAVR